MISRAALGGLLRDHLDLRGCPVVSPADPRVPQSVECAQEFGLLLAQFHAAADDFAGPEGSSWTGVHRYALMGSDPEWLSRLYSDNPEDESLLLEWWELASAVLSTQKGNDVGMCHGEAYPATCRHVGGGLAIAELDWVGHGDRAYDLATYRWVLAVHAENAGDNLFTAFVDAYGEIRSVPDLEALRAWVAARHFWSLRLAAGFADRAGLARRAAFAPRWRIGG